MDRDDGDERVAYGIVRNHEDQYSIWAVGTSPPPGWQEIGFRGDKAACLARIGEVWTDMRPLSVRAATGIR